ncbi:hypothetical protein HY969_04600 [Candidatus Kaiserbacteria bacterium]|nr:hypothetical protein [Candidatus Kaiserbacteria bacterium]
MSDLRGIKPPEKEDMERKDLGRQLIGIGSKILSESNDDKVAREAARKLRLIADKLDKSTE